MKQLPKVNLKKTGENISKIRKSKNISARDLQGIMNFSTPQSIYKWEKGICLPAIDNLVILSSIFDLSIEEILVIERGD